MERTENFVNSLLTNRLGIVLATLNLCLLASRNFVQNAFSQPLGADCFYWSKSQIFLPAVTTNLTETFIILNLPAFMVAQIPTFLTNAFLGEFCALTEIKIGIFFFAIFIVLQWLFIASLAKTLARTF